MQARIIYFEIPAIAPQRCMDFYSKVFGWEFSKLDSGDQWLCRTGPDELPGINGIICQATSPGQQLTNTLYVNDLEQTQQAVIRNGGLIHGPEIIMPGLGRMLYFKDPEGHLQGALQADDHAKG